MRATNDDITLVVAWTRQFDDAGNPLKPRLPLGVTYLLGALHRAGYRASVRDIQHANGSPLPALLDALEYSAPVVGVSCMNDLLPAVLVAVSDHKRDHPGKTVILGGPGPTGVAEELLSAFRAVDIIVKGEGEQTLVDLLDCLREDADLAKVAGIVYQNDGRPRVNAAQPRLQNLDNLHPLPFNVFELHRYHATLPVSTSRGCPYNCAFCDIVGLWGRSTTFRSLDSVLAELNDMTHFGVTNVTFVDDTFVLERSRVEAFCQRMRDEQLGHTWHCNGRINLMDERLLSRMVSGGCRSVFYGIESGSDRILTRINKAFSAEQAERTVRLTARYVQTRVSFIWGFPFETFDDFKATWALAHRLAVIRNVTAQLFLLAPLPNTLIHGEYGAAVVFDPALRSDLSGCDVLSAEELDLIRDHPTVFASFYTYPTVRLSDKLRWLMRNPLP